ncbi:hypothetical protein AGMMS49573_07320 [Endomicrobiia bacterium]|nr:hypothetical protein AGMMS49573_07320 [Endomicrobiia bacterium]
MNIFLKIKKRIADNISIDSFMKMKRLWINYVLPQRKLLAVSVLFMVIFGVLEAVSVKLFEPVFDKVFIDKNKEVLTWIAIQIVILFAAKDVA